MIRKKRNHFSLFLKMEEKAADLLRRVEIYRAKKILFEYKLDGILNKKERVKKIKEYFK